MNKQTLLIVFVSTVVLTIGLLIYTGRSGSAQALVRDEASYVLPSKPSIQAMVNAPDAEHQLHNESDARLLLSEMDGDHSQVFEAIEFGYATIVTGGDCEMDNDAYQCDGVIVTVDSVIVGTLEFPRQGG